MADRNGYIGRAPSDSSVVVARQTFSPTGITTTFTFASGYTVGYLDVFLNGAKQIEGQDYDANNGSTFTVSGGGAQSGDILEAVAYKAFNVSNIKDAPGDFTVGNNLSVVGHTTATQAVYTGVVTASSFSGDGSALTGVAGGKFSANATGISTTTSVGIGTTNATGAADSNNTAVLNVGVVTANFFYGNGANLTGVANTENVIGTAITMTTGNITGNLTVGGVLTYDDVTNVDSIGIVTARSGVKVVGGGVSITAGGLHVTAGITTVGGGLTLTDNVRAKFGTGGDLEIYHDGSNSRIVDSGTGQLILQSNAFRVLNAAGSENMIDANENGAVELYYDSDMHFATTSDGCKTNGDLSFRGDGDTEQILFDASDASLKFTDSKKAKFGTGDDLQIYHDGSNSIIKDNGTGKLILDTDGAAIEFQKQGLETIATFNSDGAVDLYHNNSKKLETTSGGVTVTGTLAATAVTGDGSELTNLPASGDSNDITASLFI